MMSKASQTKAKKPIETTNDLKVIAKVMKRNYSRFMTKLGAHITHLAIFETNKVLKIAKKGFRFIKNKAMPKILKVTGTFISLNDRVINSIKNTEEYFYQLDDHVCDTKVNKGFLSAAKLFLSSIFRSLWNLRGHLVSLFNWVAPVVSIVFLVNVVSFATNLNYGVSVECNGETLGLISEEADYDVAEKALQERITYVEGNEKVVITPKLSVQIVRDSQEIVKPTQLVDKMIDNSGAELSNAYGIYVDGKFLGSVADRQPIMDALANILAKYQSTEVKSINFQKAVEYKSGLYIKSSLVKTQDIVNLLTSDTQVEAYYTIQSGDTPIKIAAKNNVNLTDLVALNPSIVANCKIGAKVILNRAEPYMQVQVVKDVQYTDTIDYETVKVDNNSLYKGNEKVLVEGKEGEATVTAEVTYMNGYEVGRTITNTVVTLEPVTKKLSIGTLTPKPTKGVTISGNGQYAWPVAGGYISQGFKNANHKGVDIAAKAGTSIFAAESGTVIMSQRYYGYGNCIMIKHPDGNVTVYGHQSKLIATVGQQVQKGELIGLVGNTGDSDGNHCHFEVRVNGMYTDPMKYIG